MATRVQRLLFLGVLIVCLLTALLQYSLNTKRYQVDVFVSSTNGKYRLGKSKVQPSHEHKPACVIPKLDPFAKEAMSYVKEVEKNNCHKKDYAVLQNGILKLKRSGIRDVLIRYFRRAENDDFNIDYSDPVSILDHDNKLQYLDTGITGCIVTRDGHYLSISRGKTVTWKKTKDCIPEHYVKVLENGAFGDFKTNRCIIVRRNSSRTANDDEATSYKLEFTDDCINAASRFTIHSSGAVELKGSGKCLAISYKNNNAIGLELVSNCSSKEVHLKISAFPAKDLDIRFPITREFFEVIIADKDSIHSELHIQIQANNNISEAARKKRTKSKLGYNVAFLMFDSQSAANFERKMKKTFKFLNENENSIILKGHTINGDGTTAQLCALLIGMLEEDLPEARRGRPSSGHVDRWPFIFKKFSEEGYVTMFSEDDPYYSSFTYRLYGFKRPPADHYIRPFWLRVEDSVYDTYCVGGKTTCEIGLDNIKNFHDVYRKMLKFSFTSFSSISHNNMNTVQSGDNDIFGFLQDFKRKGHMDDTILIIFSDHGLRAADFRETIQGKLEERLPFMSITLPPSLIKSHPEIYEALKHNSDVLTTHFDMHATLKHILNYPRQPWNITGLSLFTHINQSTRTCESAGIKDHWCPCLTFSEVKVTETDVVNGVELLLKHINEDIIDMNEEASKKCAKLTLKLIKRASIRLPGEAVQTFKNTFQNSKCDECGVVKSKKKSMRGSDKQEYEFVFSVEPSNGLFEATATKNGTQWIIDGEISRLNLYGDQPKCIQDKYPELRKFCYCK